MVHDGRLRATRLTGAGWSTAVPWQHRDHIDWILREPLPDRQESAWRYADQSTSPHTTTVLFSASSPGIVVAIEKVTQCA